MRLLRTRFRRRKNVATANQHIRAVLAFIDRFGRPPEGPSAPTGRQQLRRVERKAEKTQQAARVAAVAKADLTRLRVTRSKHSLPKRVPGKLLPTGRAYKKPHGQASWRVAELGALDCIERFGQPLKPLGLEATFHMTKGLRVVRVSA